MADNRAPLLAIADVAGSEWPQRARRALEAIQATAEDASIRVQLLTDICVIFDEYKLDRLPSDKLIEALIAIEGRPWAEWKAGKPLSKNGLARLLKPLKIRPGTKPSPARRRPRVTTFLTSTTLSDAISARRGDSIRHTVTMPMRWALLRVLIRHTRAECDGWKTREVQ